MGISADNCLNKNNEDAYNMVNGGRQKLPIYGGMNYVWTYTLWRKRFRSVQRFQ